MMLLYSHDRGEAWYRKGLDLVLQQIKGLPADASHYSRYLLLNAYGDLLREKAAKTGIDADRQAAIDIYDKAVAEAESDTQISEICGSLCGSELRLSAPGRPGPRNSRF
jgi:hypothetical protein